MSQPFFERPIINSPYGYPNRHWELDSSGQPTNQMIDRRRVGEFITPIPKPKKQKKQSQQELFFNEATEVLIGRTKIREDCSPRKSDP